MVCTATRGGTSHGSVFLILSSSMDSVSTTLPANRCLSPSSLAAVPSLAFPWSCPTLLYLPRYGTNPACGPQSELLPLTWKFLVGYDCLIQRCDHGPVDR